MLYELYLVTNNINGKRYVGQTQSSIGYQQRFKSHIAEAHYSGKSNCYFHNAIVKYGSDNFTLKRLFKNIPEEKIDFLETLWIEKLDTYFKNNHGYNMTIGGQGVHGYHHTEETKKKLSKYFKGRSMPKESVIRREKTKRDSGYYEYRRDHTDWRQKVSMATKERFKNNPGTFTGKSHTEEAKMKIAIANGYKIAMCDINTGEELRIFISAAEAGRYLNSIGATTNKTPNSRIFQVCNGLAKTAYGFKWKFVECND